MIFDLYDYENNKGYIFTHRVNHKYYFDEYDVDRSRASYKFIKVVRMTADQVRAIHGQALIKIYGW